jgi:DNA-binding MarR family transcriptional regulator
MPIDALIANSGRLRILTALAGGAGREFVELRAATRLTDGNLSSHAKRLAGAGVIRIQKEFREGRPVTTLMLTGEGRRRLEEHVRELVAAVGSSSEREGNASGARVVDEGFDEGQAAEDWVD